ncbi:hypothetical protein E0T12_24015 [Salmonella enterica subsp. enterica serovar Senftenberg]|nr:hypothetical protein [Salmonella enterica subsp. enterica serovar Senftenberg]
MNFLAYVFVPLALKPLKGELHDKVIGHYLNIKHYQ